MRAAACVTRTRCPPSSTVATVTARAVARSHQAVADARQRAFYSTIINLRSATSPQAAILKDVQRHPAKNAVLHVDLQRVLEDEKIRISIPLHFKNEAVAPA